MKKRIALPLLFLFFAAAAFSQNNKEPGGFRHITVRDGLPSSEVYSVIQDRLGYIWMCTDAGVCRYNGYAFQSFTTRDGLTDNTVFRLKQDKSGHIWAMGFSGAMSYFDGKRFNGIPANDSLVSLYRNGQRFNYCTDTDSAGGLTIGGLNTYGCFRVGPEDHFAEIHPVESPIEEKGFRVVWTTPGHHIFCFGGFGTERIASFFHNGHTTKIVLPSDPGITTSCSIVLTRDNKVLFTYMNHLYSIDENGEVNQSDFPGTVVGLDEDKEGNIWVSLFYNGVYMCPDGNISDHSRYYFPGKTISGVFEDNEKGYWFSTVGDGVYYLPDLRFGYLTTNEGLPKPNVQSISAYGQHEVLVGLPDNMLGILNPLEKGAGYFRCKSLDPNSAYQLEAINAINDSIFISVNGYEIVDTSFQVIKKLDFGGHSKGVTRNKRTNELLFFTPGDLVFFDAGLNGKKIPTKVRFTSACYGNDGTIWLGALNGLWKLVNDVPVYMGDSAQGLKVRIDGMIEDAEGTLWIATRGEGAYAINGKQKWHFGEKEGLAGSTCRAITIDENGKIWVGTNRGVTMISGFDKQTGKANLRSFNSTHGLLSDEVKCLLAFDGKLWMGSNEGLCWTNINDLTEDTIAPPVYITSVLFGMDSCRLDETGVFDYSGKPIRIFVEGLCFRDPSGLRYKYRLLGGDEQWINTANREISFSGLPPGEYRLEIIAVNSDGKESTHPSVFTFRILAPFYFTWWFIALIVVTLIGLVWLGVGYWARVRQRRAKEKADTERRIAELRLSALRAQMNPHFIFNAINSIQHFVLQNDSEHAYNYLAKFSRLIRLVLDQSQSESIPLGQELKMLNLYIELEQLRFERPFKYEISVDPRLEEDNMRIPGMLVQPFVENAIWHGLLPKKTGEAWIRIVFEKMDSMVEITIEDNGVGRKASEQAKPSDGKRRSYGLLITEERLRLSETKNPDQPVIVITDSKDEGGNPSGTKVVIRIPSEDEDE